MTPAVVGSRVWLGRPGNRIGGPTFGLIEAECEDIVLVPRDLGLADVERLHVD